MHARFAISKSFEAEIECEDCGYDSKTEAAFDHAAFHSAPPLVVNVLNLVEHSNLYEANLAKKLQSQQ
jgi:hypothetical protein